MKKTEQTKLFNSFCMAGFECSTHLNGSRKRLDLIASTKHDRFARRDYERIQDAGMLVAREGVRWHLAEAKPYEYDFSSAMPIVKAAEHYGIQVIWDICHFGWPDHIDIFSEEFPSRLARFARAFAKFLSNETSTVPYFVPVNEISFFAYVGGEEGKVGPYAVKQGDRLKRQLVRGAIGVMDAIRDAVPQSRFVLVDPVINVIAHPSRPQDKVEAELNRLSQYEAWDMIGGRICPELGGGPRYLDIIGVNYYPHNQWYYDFEDGIRKHKYPTIGVSDPDYKPFREILREVSERYERPIVISETGAEGDLRGPWMQYAGREAKAAIEAGASLHGLCLYPIVDHLGWEDNRECPNGLWGFPDANGERKACEPFLSELRSFQESLEADIASDIVPLPTIVESDREAHARPLELLAS